MSESTQDQKIVDEDLDALLDSALDDFDRLKNVKASTVIARPTTTATATTTAAATVAGTVSNVDDSDVKDASSRTAENNKENNHGDGHEKTSSGTGGACSGASVPLKDQSGPWTAEFAQMEEAMKKFIDQDPLLKEQLSKITQSASKTAEASSDAEFASTLQETLENITKSIEQFQPPDGGAFGAAAAAGAGGSGAGMEEMTRLLKAMGLGNADGVGGEGGFLQMMQGLMQNLLSKDLLYPALKDLTEKYPKWLAENRDSVSADDVDRYEKQLDIMKQVCDMFDEERDSDSDDVKKDRFDRIFKLMQEMQECGNPPAALVEAAEGIPGFPTNQIPDMPSAPPECNQQ